VPESPYDRIAILQKRIRQIVNPDRPRAQTDFRYFLRNCCITKDESRAGKVAPFPDWPFLDELCDHLILERLLFIEKARRVMASWTVCAFDLWLIAGGQDPRWKDTDGNSTLLNSTENRQVFIISRKLEDAGGSAFYLDQRVRFLYTEFEKRGFREQYWPDFPAVEFAFGRARASNGGAIDCLPQGKDSSRGPGSTLVHFEELAFVPLAKDTMEGTLPVLQGGGGIVAITTANAASTYCVGLVKEKNVEGGPAVSDNPILPIVHKESGWAVLTIAHTSVPGYDLAAASRGMSPEAIRTEILIDWNATKGKRVYPEFSRDHHMSLDPILPDPSRPFYMGWDFGRVACVITQTNTAGQWLILDSISPPEDETVGIYEFGWRVADYLTQNYALPNGLALKDLRLVHFGDPAGNMRVPRTGDRPQETRTSFDILRKGLEIHVGEDIHGRLITERKEGLGWRIMPGQVGITIRLESVRARLTTTLKDGIPALVVDPNAMVVLDGFAGLYQYKEYSDGSYSREPLKNFYSHTFDCVGYIATRLFPANKFQQTEEEEEDDPGPRVTSMARRY
jgi:hypothetical protein